MRVLLVIGVTIALRLLAYESRSEDLPPWRPRPFRKILNRKHRKGARKMGRSSCLDEVQQQKGHVVVAPARATEVAATLTVPGRLTVSEDQTWHVGAIASGRIERYPRGSAIPSAPARSSAAFTAMRYTRLGLVIEEAKTELQRSQSAEDYAQQRRAAHRGSSNSRPGRVRISSRRRQNCGMRRQLMRRRKANWRRNART